MLVDIVKLLLSLLQFVILGFLNKLCQEGLFFIWCITWSNNIYRLVISTELIYGLLEVLEKHCHFHLMRTERTWGNKTDSVFVQVDFHSHLSA